MAIFRKIHTQFWSDPFVQTLPPEKKYFYLYLLTNEKTKQCGIYEITIRQISYDTGYNIEAVLLHIEYFISVGKILFSRETNEIAVKNWKKYNDSRSPGVQKCINEELTKVKNGNLVQWVQSGGRVGGLSLQEEQEEEEEKEPEKEREGEEEKKNQQNLIFDAEKEILGNQLQFERICMAAKKTDVSDAKESLRKFHLFLIEKDKYPQKRRQIYAGFEKWLLTEKKLYNGTGTHKQISGSTDKLGTSDARIDKASKW